MSLAWHVRVLGETATTRFRKDRVASSIVGSSRTNILPIQFLTFVRNSGQATKGTRGMPWR